MAPKMLLLLALMIAATLVQANAAGLSCEDKKKIVDMHNELRMQVAKGSLRGQPKASNMQMVVWDDRLATLAQSWADRSSYGHNEARKDSRWRVGENIARTSTKPGAEKPDWSRPIKKWFDEHLQFSYTSPNPNAVTGHYTQIVWADTLYVGCGHRQYKDGEWWRNYYVCNYGPTGNFGGDDPYEKGPGCEHLCCGTTHCARDIKKYGSLCR